MDNNGDAVLFTWGRESRRTIRESINITMIAYLILGLIVLSTLAAFVALCIEPTPEFFLGRVSIFVQEGKSAAFVNI